MCKAVLLLLNSDLDIFYQFSQHRTGGWGLKGHGVRQWGAGGKGDGGEGGGGKGGMEGAGRGEERTGRDRSKKGGEGMEVSGGRG